MKKTAQKITGSHPTPLNMSTSECHEQFNWIHPRTIAVMSNMFIRKVCEALEINKLKTINETDKTFKVLNRDNGD